MQRREFLRKTGIGAAVAGAAWVAPSVVGYDVAFAGASCNRTDSIDWSTKGTGTAFVNQSFTAVGAYPALTVSLGVTSTGGQTAVAGNETVQGGSYGGQTANFWKLFMVASNSGQGYNATFTFSVPVYNLRFSVFDIDRYNPQGNGGGFQDVVWLTNNPTFSFARPGANPVVNGSGTSGDPWVGTTNDEVPLTSNNGNVNVTMPVASAFTLNYRSGNQDGQQQSIGIGNLVFCR